MTPEGEIPAQSHPALSIRDCPTVSVAPDTTTAAGGCTPGKSRFLLGGGRKLAARDEGSVIVPPLRDAEGRLVLPGHGPLSLRRLKLKA